MARRWLIGAGLGLAVALTAGAACAADPGLTSVRLGDSLDWPTDPPPSSAAFAGVTAGLPSWLRWALTPQLQLGNTAPGPVDHSYQGLSWTVPLAGSVLQQHDALSFGFGFSFGHGFGDLSGAAEGFDPRSLRPTPTTRLGAVIGYQVTPDIGLFVQFDRVASGRTARDDDISNNLGMRIGLHF